MEERDRMVMNLNLLRLKLVGARNVKEEFALDIH